MFKNYFKTAWRNLWRSKAFSIINISGLAIGMASAILILLWIQNEISYDRFHLNRERLYQAWNREKSDNKLQCWSTTPEILGPTLKQDYPEVEKETRVNWNQTLPFSAGEKRLSVSGTMVDPDFLTMFSFPLLSGNQNTALNSVYSIVVTEELAKKLFGNEDAMGKVIKIDNKDNFTVTGVMKNLPNNTQFNFEYLLPWQYMSLRQWDDSDWDNNSTQNYILLKKDASITAFNSSGQPTSGKVSDFVKSSDVSLGLGLGWDLPFGLNLTARYNMGLSDINKQSGVNSPLIQSSLGTKEAKNQVFQFSVGYRLFKLGK